MRHQERPSVLNLPIDTLREIVDRTGTGSSTNWVHFLNESNENLVQLSRVCSLTHVLSHEQFFEPQQREENQDLTPFWCKYVIAMGAAILSIPIAQSFFNFYLRR